MNFFDRNAKTGVTVVFATVYVAIGALLHTVLLGTTFNPANVFAWGILFAWPVVLFVMLLLAAFAIFGVVAFIAWVMDLYASIPWVRRRRMAQVMRYVRPRSSRAARI